MTLVYDGADGRYLIDQMSKNGIAITLMLPPSDDHAPPLPADGEAPPPYAFPPPELQAAMPAALLPEGQHFPLPSVPDWPAQGFADPAALQDRPRPIPQPSAPERPAQGFTLLPQSAIPAHWKPPVAEQRPVRQPAAAAWAAAVQKDAERLERLAGHIRTAIDTNITQADFYKGVGLLHRQSKASANLFDATRGLLSDIARLEHTATEERMLQDLAAAVVTAATRHKLDLPNCRDDAQKFKGYLDVQEVDQELQNYKMGARERKLWQLKDR
jgi:hypothetical protein